MVGSGNPGLHVHSHVSVSPFHSMAIGYHEGTQYYECPDTCSTTCGSCMYHDMLDTRLGPGITCHMVLPDSPWNERVVGSTIQVMCTGDVEHTFQGMPSSLYS